MPGPSISSRLNNSNNNINNNNNSNNNNNNNKLKPLMIQFDHQHEQ